MAPTSYNDILHQDKPREECGVFGISRANQNAASLTFLALHALQHRGQEAAGIVTLHEGNLYSHKGLGLVANVFAESNNLVLPGQTAIGHVRYGTMGGSSFTNAQPFTARYGNIGVALAHNGTLCRQQPLHNALADKGALFQTTSDTELILHMLAQAHATTNEEIAAVLGQIGAAFSLVMLLDDQRLIAARDPWGFRPLSLGSLGSGFVVASETCAFDQLGATYIRDIEPGEMLVIDKLGFSSYHFNTGTESLSQCLLELIYFARPDSIVFGQTPHMMRERSGAALAAQHPVDADIVVAIPDSGMSAAMGYATAMGIPHERGLIRNHYVGRSFILPGHEARATAVRMKHNIVRSVVEGKRVCLVDDSLIRGTTTASLNKALREAGAKEVHLRIASPPTRFACPYGVDFPSTEELMAHKHSVEEIRTILGMDSIGYLSIEGLTGVCKGGSGSYCSACWSGEYRA